MECLRKALGAIARSAATVVLLASVVLSILISKLGLGLCPGPPQAGMGSEMLGGVRVHSGALRS